MHIISSLLVPQVLLPVFFAYAFLWLIIPTLWLGSAVLIWVHFNSAETFRTTYGGNCLSHLNALFYSEASWVLWFYITDPQVITSLPDLYNKSNFCIICSASYKVQGKGGQSLRNINEKSIRKVEVKCDKLHFQKANYLWNMSYVDP